MERISSDMHYVGYINRTSTPTKYTIFMQSAMRQPGISKGYFSSEHSKDLLDAIHTSKVLNCIEYGQDRKVHALLQPTKATPTMLAEFTQSQFCIGYAKGIRKSGNAQAFFDEHTKYVDATSGPNAKITLVPEMRLTHALNGQTVVKVLRALLNNGYVTLDDILVFNLTTGGFWSLTGV